jgi:actin-like ATPase involved in cell morphogenesis
MPLPGDYMDAEEIKKIDEIFKRHVDVVTENFKHHVGVMYEDFQHKLDIVVEGHQMLAEKIDRMDVRLERVEDKVDAVTTDLAAHRADTEVHGTVYRVKESGE